MTSTNANIFQILKDFQATAEYTEQLDHLAVTCPVCSYVVHRKEHFEDHIAAHGYHEDPLTFCPDAASIHLCAECKVGFLSNREFTAHWSECHPFMPKPWGNVVKPPFEPKNDDGQ